MRVGILSLKAGTAAGGLATYEANLIHALADADRESEYHVFCVHPVSRATFAAIDQPNFIFHELRPRQRMLNMLWSAPRAIRRSGVDFFHVMFLPPLTLPAPFVFTAHGPEMFVDPTFFPLRIRLLLLPLIRRCYRRAASILCVSGDTRGYLVQHYPDAEARSRVVYNGCLELFQPQDEADVSRILRDDFNIDFPYILAVGRIEPRKNPIRLLEAYARFRERASDPPRLVIAGGATWSKGEARAAIERLKLADHVVLPGHVPHEKLPVLYAGAEMFVFPSLWEGFGLPVVEAMRSGCPVITSSVSCLPEVAGGAASLVDPASVESIADAMLRLHEDDALRSELREKGFARGREFSWSRCARETVAAYRDLHAQLGADAGAASAR